MRYPLVVGLLTFFMARAGANAATVGEPAPDFHAVDTTGKTHSRDTLHGKFAVLEWHNRECPYVKKHYQSGNMQALQARWTQKGVVWLTVLSSAPGKPGFLDAAAATADMQQSKATPSAVILDAKGELARQFAAKTTPHMFVLGPDGKVIYAGAIDDKPGTDAAEVPNAQNYVSAALQAAMAGQSVAVASTTPYGCSVKY